MLSRLLSRVPVSVLDMVAPTNPVIVYYHIVTDDDSLHVKHLYRYKAVRQFKADLDFLLKTYTAVSLADLLETERGGRDLPERSFLLTFDDGFREMHDIVAPLLLEKGIPAVFFVSSAFVDNKELCYQHKASLLAERIRDGISPEADAEIKGLLLKTGFQPSERPKDVLKVDYARKAALDGIADILCVDFQEYLRKERPYLTSAQIGRLIGQGFSIGAHSIDHPHYAALSLSEQLEQTLESVKRIREQFGVKEGSFAFPHNDVGVSSEFFESVRKSGLVDITFGTGGMADGRFRMHRQRTSLENPSLSAKELLAWQYLRKVYKRFCGRERSG